MFLKKLTAPARLNNKYNNEIEYVERFENVARLTILGY